MLYAVPDRHQPFQVEHMNTSVAGSGSVMMQGGRVGASYTSSKFSQAEMKFATTEQELLVLVCALQAWRCYLEMCLKTELLFVSGFPRFIKKGPGRSCHWKEPAPPKNPQGNRPTLLFIIRLSIHQPNVPTYTNCFAIPMTPLLHRQNVWAFLTRQTTYLSLLCFL